MGSRQYSTENFGAISHLHDLEWFIVCAPIIEQFPEWRRLLLAPLRHIDGLQDLDGGRERG